MAANGQHSDFGEKIGGARKDLWGKRGLLSSDLSEMNEREADKYVRKDNVWKKNDYQAMIDSGTPAHVVYFIKTVRDSLPASPPYLRGDDTPEKRLDRQKQYIDTIREVQGTVESVQTREDAQRVFAALLLDGGYLEPSDGISIYYRSTEKRRQNPVISDKLVNALHITSDREYESKIVRPAARAQFGVPKEEKVPQGYEVLYHDGTHSWSQNNDWITDTWYVAKGHRILKTNLATREDAVKWAQEAAAAQPDGKKKRFVPPQLERIRRDGPDYRSGRDVEGQDYLDSFHFRGGEFGNWMSQNDRRVSLNMGFEALKDLADALKITDPDISYNGDLSIAFGARGSGNAVAHYEPLRQVINLTKMRGAGSLAHEWWHGLDDYLGRKLGVKGLLSEHPHKHPLFGKLINTIKFKPETPEQAAKRTETQNANILRGAANCVDSTVLSALKRKTGEPELAQYETLKDAFLRGEAGSVNQLSALKKSVCGRVIPKEEREHLLLFEGALRSMRERESPFIGKVPTEYYLQSKGMGKACEKDGGYWESNTELTARAFATYVMDRLPYRSDYLVGHAECAIGATVDQAGDLQILKAYPEGAEREAINAVFDELVAELKMQHYLTHDERVRPEPQVKEPIPFVLADLRDASFEQLTFANMGQTAVPPVPTPLSCTRIEFVGPENDRLSLHEYGDRVELHRDGRVETLTPSAGTTAKDVFLSRMSELVGNGCHIRAAPPAANDPAEVSRMQEFLDIGQDDETEI